MNIKKKIETMPYRQRLFVWGTSWVFVMLYWLVSLKAVLLTWGIYMMALVSVVAGVSMILILYTTKVIPEKNELGAKTQKEIEE